MATTDNVRRLDDAMTDRGQPIPISLEDKRRQAEESRNEVLDRLAVVRLSKRKNAEQREALDHHDFILSEEEAQLEGVADAMLTTIHAFDRIGQGRV